MKLKTYSETIHGKNKAIGFTIAYKADEKQKLVGIVEEIFHNLEISSVDPYSLIDSDDYITTLQYRIGNYKFDPENEFYVIAHGIGQNSDHSVYESTIKKLQEELEKKYFKK